MPMKTVGSDSKARTPLLQRAREMLRRVLRYPLASQDDLEGKVKADLAVMQRPEFSRIARVLEKSVPEGDGFGRLRGRR